MSTHRAMDRICVAAVVLSLVLTLLFMNGHALGIASAGRTIGYEDRLFDSSRVHTIDIVMDDWDGFLDTCQSEEYTACSLVIDGESYKNVGIRGKGNTSLSSVAQMGSSRYSFKVEFDQYDDTRSYHGLDKLSLNNLIQDNTMMKDYLTYQMMDAFGAAGPLSSFVYLTVNGEDWGLYLAVEAVEEAFLQRNYGSSYGELYKPDSMSFGGGRGNGRDFDINDFAAPSDGENGGQTGPFARPGRPGTAPGSGSFTPPENGTSERTGEDGQAGQQPSGTAPGGADPGQSDGSSAGNFAAPEAGSADATPGQALQQPSDAAPDGTDSGSFDPSTVGSFTPEGGSSENAGEGGQDPRQPFGTPPDGADFGSFDPSAAFSGGGSGGGFSFGSASDVKLQYIDDNPDSYANIFDNAKTDPSDADRARLIDSLKALSQYEDLENVLDTDAVLRYFVVHSFVVNGDSYTGGMIHNYYLYEEDGRLSMIPWDYNLAFGTFQAQDAASSVNDPIDDALSDRPMQAWIFSDEGYTQRYHELYAQFLDTVDAAQIIDSAYALIADYVAKDPTKFCTYEAFESGVQALRTFCALRQESVRGQLDGTIPSTSEEQSARQDALVSAEGLDLSDMGTMGGGPGNLGGGDGRTPPTAQELSTGAPDQESNSPDTAGGQPSNDNSDASGGQPSGGRTEAAGNQPSQGDLPGDRGGGTPPGNQGGGFAPPGEQTGAASQPSPVLLLAASVAILLAGLLIAFRFRR